MISKIKEFFKKNEADIILVIGIVLIATTSFGFGWILARNQSLNSSLAKNSENEIKIEENEPSFKNPEEKNNIENLKADINSQQSTKENSSPEKSSNNSQSSFQKESYKTAPSQNNSSANNNCKYVGSKNSDIYHLPDCPGAKRIKEENKRCFSSKEEAEKAGYRPAKNCPGLQ